MDKWFEKKETNKFQMKTISYIFHFVRHHNVTTSQNPWKITFFANRGDF